MEVPAPAIGVGNVPRAGVQTLKWKGPMRTAMGIIFAGMLVVTLT